MPAPPDDRIVTRLRDAGLHRVSLSAANEMGRVNVWIVLDDPLTLIDSGIRAPGAFAELQAGFAAVGRRVEDVGLVVLTHQHTDHVGLAAEVVRRSGAELAAPAPLVPYLADYPGQSALDRAFMAELLRRHGATEADVAGNARGWASFHELGESCAVTVPLAAGSRVTLAGRTFEVLARPGHSETDVLLVDAERDLVLGGDHLLRATPSVTVRDRPLGDAGGDLLEDDLAVLLRYRRSLRATRSLPVDLVLPGHGGPFTDPGAVVDAHLLRQEESAAALLARVGTEPFTAGGLARAVWPDASAGLAMVLLSSVLGGLGLLRAEGRVAVADPGGDGRPVRFAAI